MKTEAIPRLSVIDSLATGLTEAARRPWLITIPLITELLLWLAPPFSISVLLQSFVSAWEAVLRSAYTPGQVAGMGDMIASVRDIMAAGGRHLQPAGRDRRWLAGSTQRVVGDAGHAHDVHQRPGAGAGRVGHPGNAH